MIRSKLAAWLCGLLSLSAQLLLPGWSIAQDLGDSLHTPSEGTLLETKLHNESIVQAALRQPIDSQTVYRRLNNLSGDQTYTTRGAREAQIYSSLSPAVVLVLTNESIGSGSLIDLNGTILTNWHVIEGYETVGVIFKPEREGEKVSVDAAIFADVIKIDEIADLAMLRVREKPVGVKPIPLGSMSEAEIGADVHAIGHPTGETWTYTRGFVSQYRKDYEWITESGVEHKGDVIQTQTPINPGNSGGPLISSNGHLIGVNSFKASGEALNFAVSVDEVRRFLSMKSDRIAVRSRPATSESSADCGDEPEETFRSEDGSSTISLYDFDCDGEVDASYTEPDDRSKGVFFSMDTSGDGKIDTIFFDEDRDGNIDYSIMDQTGDGEPDLVGYYRNGEEEPYKIEKYSG